MPWAQGAGGPEAVSLPVSLRIEWEGLSDEFVPGLAKPVGGPVGDFV